MDSARPASAHAPDALARPVTLGGVLESIPTACYENPTWKGVAWIARDFAVYGALLALLLSTDRIWLLLPLWALSGLVLAGLFILGHDAAHGALFKSKRLNYVLGQLAMLPSLHLYQAWVFGHNRIHHGHTVREELDYVWHPLTVAQYRALPPLGKLAHRLKWSWLGAGIYYMHEIWWRRMIHFTPNDKLRAGVLRDRIVVGSFALLASLGLGLAGAEAYGGLSGALWLWLKLGVLPFVAFNWVVGWAVYVHHISPEIPWHERRAWDKFKGQIEGTTILHVPRWLNFFLHNILLHVPHHVDMRIPFYGLPAASQALLGRWGKYIVERRYHLADYVRATRHCKLYDFQRQAWLGYPS